MVALEPLLSSPHQVIKSSEGLFENTPASRVMFPESDLCRRDDLSGRDGA